MVPPTFESDHGSNEFTSLVLLHHFLSEDDIRWLSHFEEHGLNENEKKALVFLQEVGALDNHTYRQISGLDVLRASIDLRRMKSLGLLKSKGKGRATYYIAGEELNTRREQSTPPPNPSTPPLSTATESFLNIDNELIGSGLSDFPHPSAPPLNQSAPPSGTRSAPPSHDELPQDLLTELELLGNKADSGAILDIIVKLCTWRELQTHEIAHLLGRSEKYVLRKFITPLRESGRLAHTIPDMVNHPQQAYKAVR
jgi:ATP-dependent DNA helicase RecG